MILTQSQGDFLTAALSLLSVVLLVALVLGVLLYLGQERMIFPGQSTAGWIPAKLPARSEEISLQLDSGEALYGVFLKARPGSGAVLFFGGNGESIAGSLEDLEGLREHGQHVLMVDYPGYGGSEGSPSSDSFLALADVAFRWLAERDDVGRIVLVGRSIGSGPACHLAARHQVAGLMLFAGFSSLRAAAGEHFPYLPASSLLRHDFDNLSALATIQAPTLIFHNRDDEIISPRMADQLAEAAAGPVTLVFGDDGGHNGIEFAPGTAAGRAIASFLPSLSQTIASEEGK